MIRRPMEHPCIRGSSFAYRCRSPQRRNILQCFLELPAPMAGSQETVPDLPLLVGGHATQIGNERLCVVLLDIDVFALEIGHQALRALLAEERGRLESQLFASTLGEVSGF